MRNLTRLLCVLGLMVSVALAESLDETRRKAEKGDAVAQHDLGLIYKYGMPQDYAEAVKWYRKAAEQGYATAQTSLGLMYEKGDGVPKDLMWAHVWYNIAGAAGDENAKKNLAIVEKEMTPDQKAEAMNLAREMFAKLPKKK